MSALTQEIQQAVREAFGALVKEGTLREQRLKTKKEAARYLKLSERTVDDMLAQGEIPRVQREGGSRVMIDVQDLDRWIEDHKE